MRKMIQISSAVMLAALSACNSSSNSNSPSAMPEVFLERVVRMNKKGELTITVHLITADDERKEIKAREERLAGHGENEIAQAITDDPRCAPSDLWLFSRTGQTGNKICLSGAGTAQLHDLHGSGTLDGGGGTWDDAVKSYWAGSETGGFYGPGQAAGQLFCSTGFAAWQRVDNADNCTQQAQQAFLTN